MSQFPALTPPQTNCFLFHKWVRVKASFGTLAVQYLHLRKFTVLESSTIIEDDEKICEDVDSHKWLYYYYFDFKEDEKGPLPSGLFPLCHQSDSCHDTLAPFYWTHRDGTQSPATMRLVRLLGDIQEKPPFICLWIP